MGKWLTFTSGLLAMLIVSCSDGNNEFRSGEEQQQQLRDESACEGEISKHDPWGAVPLSERCERVDRAHKRKKENQRPAVVGQTANVPDPPSPCVHDSERLAWLDRPLYVEDGQPITPRMAGYRVGGRCNTELVVKGFSCDPKSVADVHYDSPVVAVAADAGFKMLVCERISDGQRSTYPYFLGPRSQPEKTKPTGHPREVGDPPPEKHIQAVRRPIEVVSDDPDRYAFGLVENFKPRAEQGEDGGADPVSITDAMFETAVRAVMPQIKACGRTSTATGTVVLEISIQGSGEISASVTMAPDTDLGECVASNVKKMAIGRTRTGGSFHREFTF